MSLMIMKGENYIVRKVTTFAKEETGETGYRVIIGEAENRDNKSKREFKLWCDSIPEGLKAGDRAVVVDYVGSGVKDEPIGEIYGETKFKAAFVYTGVTLKEYVTKQEKPAKK